MWSYREAGLIKSGLIARLDCICNKTCVLGPIHFSPGSMKVWAYSELAIITSGLIAIDMSALVKY